jgi:addiction module HigA family antidote
MTQTEQTGAIHPGEVLREDFLIPLGITAYRLAKAIGVTESAVSDILNGRRGITAATALLLARFFGTTPELWLNLQAAYELDAERDRLGASLEAITPAELDELHRQRMATLEERRRPLHAALPEERARMAEDLEAVQPLDPQEPAPA